MKLFSALLQLLGIFVSVYGQTSKTITNQEQVWTGLTLNHSLKNNHVITYELENRVFISPYKQGTALFRFNYRIPINHLFSFSVGFANFYQWSQNDQIDKGDFAVPEYRPHIDFYHHHRLKRIKWTLTGRLRNEYRIFHDANSTELTPGYYAYLRTRYRFLAEHEVNENAKHLLLFRLGSEVHFNSGNEIVYNHFDQLRIITGIQLKLNNYLQIGTEYIYWYQHRTIKNAFYQRNIFRILLNFTLSSKEKNK